MKGFLFRKIYKVYQKRVISVVAGKKLKYVLVVIFQLKEEKKNLYSVLSPQNISPKHLKFYFNFFLLDNIILYI